MIADSNAVSMAGRVLVQHQAALTLIRAWTQDPLVSRIRWLDLACGRGQILSNIEHVIPDKRREKIEYLGIDVSENFGRDAERRAKALFRSAKVEICELQYFESHLKDGDSFDIVTCTNTVHEISPEALAETLIGALCRTGMSGCLFLYDMERLPELELGAIPWRGKEMERIVHEILRSANVQECALPDVAVWPHSSVSCWNIQLHRRHLQVATLGDCRHQMVTAAAAAIRATLIDKLVAIESALSSATRYGTETQADRDEVHRLLFDHWAVSRVLGCSSSLLLGKPC